MDTLREILTPEQAAEYLQVDRETIYRYIHQGKLIASKLGRHYRIPRRSVEHLLACNRVRPDVPLREYTDEQIEQFLIDDQLTPEQAAIAERFEQAMRARRA